jgi:hypothetical protein
VCCTFSPSFSIDFTSRNWRIQQFIRILF